MSNLHIIYNPVAGNGTALGVYEKIVKTLDERGIAFTSAKSAYAGHAVPLAQNALAEGHSCVVALGGDGTVREVASVLAGTDTVMGVIACGTGNDLARPLGIPRDPIAALDVILAGSKRHMDAVRVNDELCFNIAGFGFDVDVLDYVEIYKKKYKNGSLAYVRGLLAAVSRLKLRKTTITWPDGTIEKNVLFLAVGNGTHFGGGMFIAPKADPFDGLLDVCVVHDVNTLSLLSLLRHLRTGNHINETKLVTYFRTTELTAVCEPPSRLDIDGDVLPGTPVSFRILPKSVWVLVPKAQEA